MKVLFVNGSSHIHGTTMKALEEMIKIFEEEKIETEVIQLGGKPLADCTQCNSCQKTGQCVFKEDGVNEFVAKAREADGFVFATPVYFAHPSGRIFSFLDRAFYSNGKDEVYEAFQFKPSAAVSVIPDKQAALKMQPEAEKFIIIGCLTAWVLCCCGWK
jgi:multimeric flavodoxin WrbA